MKMIKAVVRPEKSDVILTKLCENGYRAATRFSILGRGKQRGLKVDNVYYDEISKEVLMIVVRDEDVDKVTDIIIKNARSGSEGSFGDGKIFILPVESVYTISSGKKDL